MKRILCLLFVLAFVPKYAFSQTSSKLVAVNPIDTFITKQAQITSGTEWQEGRKMLQGKINKDNVKLVLYTIEGIVGNNNSSQFLVVFVGKKGKFTYKAHIQIGGKGIRFANFDSIDEDTIILNTNEYLETDGLCCPTGTGKARYVLFGDNLIELSSR